MRILFILTCLANIAFAFAMVPYKAGCGEMCCIANVFSKPATICAIVVFIAMVIFICTSNWYLSKRVNWWGIPNRDYWLKEENRQDAFEHARFSAAIVGIITMLVVLLGQWIIRQNNFLLEVVGIVACCSLLFALVFESVRSYCWYSHAPGDVPEVEPPTQEQQA